MAFLVRPTNVLLVVPLFFSLALTRRAMTAFVLGGLPLAAVFLSYNYIVFGHPLQTGYGVTELWRHFVIAGAATRLNAYLHWTSMTMTPLMVIGWLALPFVRSVERWKRGLLLSWFLVFLIPYSLYDIYNEWWYTRFLLRAMPRSFSAAC
jgi:hypothetical protein